MATLPNPEIFREYDIRGRAEEDLLPAVNISLGLALSNFFRRRKGLAIVLGRDARPSSRRLRDNLIQGLVEGGIEVVDVGCCPTPALYYAVHHLSADGGVMITGSHNPPEYNGFKISVGPWTVHGEAIREIRDDMNSVTPHWSRGKVVQGEVLDSYKSAVLAGFQKPLPSNLKVVVDCGNGTAGLCATSLYEQLGCRVVPLYCEVDGTFPNHHPDPIVPEYMEELGKRVREEGADLGIGFDGDADRLGVVDRSGKLLYGDELLILFARDLLEKRPGAAIVGDVKCSHRLYRDVERMSGRGIMWKTGHSLIKSKMRETGALLAGELAGHYCFADRYFGFDDALYAGARALEICARQGSDPRALILDLPETFATPEIRKQCPESAKKPVIDALKKHFVPKFDSVTVDGLRVEFGDAWALVRASNTEPALVLRFEADSRSRLRQVRALVEERLGEVMAEFAED